VADLPGEEIVTVEAVGEVNVIEGNALATRESGLLAAQRAAVEKAVGVLVSGQMVVSQARLIEDQVFAKTAGYMKDWDVLGEEEADGLHRTRIRARVKFGDVRKDLDGLGMLIKTKKVGNPRVMILVDEKVDGKPSDTRTVETALAAALLERGYKVVDADQLAQISNDEAAVKALNGDEAMAADLAKRFGADVALVGKVDVKHFAGGKSAGGQGDDAVLGDMFSYRGRLNIKAVKASSGQMVLADTREGAGMDLTKENAAVRCLARLAEEAGTPLAEKLAPALWEGSEARLEVAGVKDFARLQDIVKVVRACDGVRNIVTRSFAGGTAVLDVELASGNANTLSAQLDAQKRVPMTVNEVAAYAIKASVAGGDAR